MHFIIHGIHHDHPNDKLRLVMPPAVAIPWRRSSSSPFTLIFGAPAAYPLFGGFIGGYLVYDYTHYYVHHFVPKSDLGKRLREQHMRHHFQDHRYGFGVSSPLWDAVFKTLPRKRRDSALGGRPQGRLELKASVGVIELVAQQFAQTGGPVAGGLGVDVKR